MKSNKIKDVEVYEEHKDAGYPKAAIVVRTEYGDIAAGSDFVDYHPHNIRNTNNITDNLDISGMLRSIGSFDLDVSDVSYDECVYMLSCRDFETDEKFVNHMESLGYWREDIPSWAWAAHHSVSRIYVGSTTRPQKRINEHLGESFEYDGAKFTEIFKPKRVSTIVFPTIELREMERRVAEHQERIGDNDFVSSDMLYR